MADVLLLIHRLPYPPNKGDKLRSYYLLQKLRSRFRVHLGCFIDDPEDRRHVAHVESLCASAKIVPLSPVTARLRSITALLRQDPLSIPYFFSRELAGWVRRKLASEDIQYVVVFSAPMAQYMLRDIAPGRYRVMDFVDVDSDKWRQYSEVTLPPVRQLYRREARQLAAYEREIAQTFDAVSFVTQNEVRLFDEISPETCRKHHVVANGVDVDYFDPALDYPDPYTAGTLPLVFTGMMNYRPNIDAMVWFARKIFPSVIEREPMARLWIVGASPTREVMRLQRSPGIAVTGRVPDVRPYLKHAALALAPLRIARGVQNKVLEAMAMGCKVLCSAEVAAGLRESPEPPIEIACSEREFAAAALRLLGSQSGNTAEGARQYVIENYDWEANLNWFLHGPAGAAEATVEPQTSLSPSGRRLARVIKGRQY